MSPLARTREEVERLDAIARRHFRDKLEKVKKRVPSLQNLTIEDYYFLSEQVHISYIPRELQVDFVCANFGDIRAGGFVAHRSKSLEVNRAIWYYILDEQHCFSRHFRDIRYNIILMAIMWAARILKSDAFDHLCNTDCGSFW
jgi:hypothetical protein